MIIFDDVRGAKKIVQLMLMIKIVHVISVYCIYLPQNS